MVVVKAGNATDFTEAVDVDISRQDRMPNVVDKSAAYPVRVGQLLCPPLSDLRNVLSSALVKDYAQSNVDIQPCPNLKESPYNLTAEGICGSCRLVEVGSPAFLAPTVDRSKKYNVSKVAKESGLPEGFLIGASAGPWYKVGKNCEMIADANCKNEINNKIAKLDEKEQCCLIQDQSGDFALLGNFFLSDGKPGDVLHVKASSRTGDRNLITVLRCALADHYKRPVGLGGVFVVKKGNVKAHIMPDFSETPLNTPDLLLKWHRFFEYQAPLTCCSVLVSKDFDNLDLRLEHSHFFSDHGQGGHYHTDTTPSEVEYEGYFMPGEAIYRLDQPSQERTNKLARFDGNHE